MWIVTTALSWMGAVLLVLGFAVFVQSWHLWSAEWHVIEFSRELPPKMENGAFWEIPVAFQTQLGLLIGLLAMAVGLKLAFPLIRKLLNVLS